MANRKSNEANIRNLTKIGRQSLGLTLPIEMVRELGWRERQPAFASAVAKAMADKKATADKKVMVKRVRGGVVVRDWKKKMRDLMR